MIDSFLTAALAACWLGILTSISPCPLATNIAAVAFVGKKVGKTSIVLLSGISYVLGRVIAYTFLGAILVAGVLTASRMSNALQEYMNLAIGPLLIIAGFFLLGIFRLHLPAPGISLKFQQKVEAWGVWGALLIGVVFALSFCPISAALFFGSLIPLAARHDSSLILPMLYGVGTGLPVLLFALIIAFSAQMLGRFLNKLALVELWSRRVTAGVFLLVGSYYSLTYIFHISL